MIEFLDFTLPAGGFAEPLAMWLACHQRLEGVCGLLTRLGRHLDDIGPDEAGRFAADGARRYFNASARRHQDDEDIDLFPRVLDQLSGRRRATVRSMMDRLQEDHTAAARLWRPVDEQLAEVQRGINVRADHMSIRRLVEKHLSHRNAEETALLGIARATLRGADLTQVGEAMAQRRGLTWKQLNGGTL